MSDHRSALARLTDHRPRAPRSLGAALAVLALAGSGVVAAVAATPPPAHDNGTVGLKQVGPIDESNGFPLWYKDTNNVRLELCLDPSDPYCIMGDVPNPQAPVSFPDNFPDEAFWSSAESSIDAGGGDSALLVTAVEAAFGSADGLPAPKQQISFGRVRVRVAGLIDGATYKVTHPFGTETLVAEVGAVKGINMTEDVGNLVWDGVFDQTLGARTGPFLKWDPNVAPAAPAGYLGDVTVGHEVVGSPKNTNFFRVEGPAGSFTGSTELCSDLTLGDSPTAADDCIESKLFNVQGKLATKAGVQVLQASYREAGTGPGDKYIDVFAKSEPGQTLIVSGTGVSQTQLRAADGQYFARVKVNGTPPSDLAVTNVSDSPRTVDHVEPESFGDKVHIQSAVYDIDAKRLTVLVDSGDSSATLKLSGYPNLAPTLVGSNTVSQFVVNNLEAPPTETVVTSSKGGFDVDDVVIDGNDLPSAQVVADLAASSTDATVNQPINLDATASQGTITGSTFTVSPSTGATLSGTGLLSRTFTATAPGSYTVTLSVTGPGTNNSSTTTVTINVAGATTAPVAKAGPDQLNIVPTSVVTLDGSASQFAASYSWAVVGTNSPAITLAGPTTANPTFTVPVSNTQASWTIRLTVTNTAGATHTDDVVVSNDPDVLSLTQATYKAGGAEWRVRGDARHCSANNTVTVTWNKSGTTPVVLGTATPTLALGVCSWDFRLKNAATALRPTAQTQGTLTVRSALGGQLLTIPFQLL